ncbi:MAG: glycine cleavage system protein GcvH [Candidatus Nanopelagicaceae bacterium]|nr:glycine cleavage system protein GcvH [Candidatus Nanopelagicaceae bacterium]
MSENPKSFRYTAEHEWIELRGDIARVGITDFAQAALGDIVYVQLPTIGQSIKAGAVCGEVESTKSVSEIYAPVDGKILQVNELLNSQPELINSDPYNQGWLFEISAPNAEIFEKLLSSDSYGEITKH